MSEEDERIRRTKEKIKKAELAKAGIKKKDWIILALALAGVAAGIIWFISTIR